MARDMKRLLIATVVCPSLLFSMTSLAAGGPPHVNAPAAPRTYVSAYTGIQHRQFQQYRGPTEGMLPRNNLNKTSIRDFAKVVGPFILLWEMSKIASWKANTVAKTMVGKK
jgi:hypothetical protein